MLTDIQIKKQIAYKYNNMDIAKYCMTLLKNR